MRLTSNDCFAWRLATAALRAVCAFAAAGCAAAAPPAPDPTPATRSWDVAIGALGTYAPEYSGSGRWTASVKPGGWVRWGRFSLASRSAFVVRTGEPVSGGGLRVDLSPSERVRIALGLRYDGGRDEGASEALRGLGTVRETIRMRLGASMPVADGWRLGGSIGVDMLGRGNGEVGDLNLSRGFALTPDTRLDIGTALGFGSRRYLQAYYGVTPAQSERSGYPVYAPKAGLRDWSASVGLRTRLSPHWVAFGGVGASRLVGPAAASPFVSERNSWSLSTGVAYRF